MSKKAIKTDGAPEAIGAYSQAVRYGRWLFCSGQIPLNPATGVMIEGDIKAQTERALQNLVAVLDAGGSTPKDVVRTTIYLADMDDFAVVNEAYAAVFSEGVRPARACVAAAGLPKGARVEIDAIARVTKG